MMPTFDYPRRPWRRAFAQGGAFVVDRLHGSFADGLLALATLNRGAAAALSSLRRSPGPSERAARSAQRAAPRALAAGAATPRRRSIALLRALHADCASCRGFGCRTCAGTGLG